jgi:hypothetical protein
MYTNAEYKRIWKWITVTYYKLLYYPSIFLKEKPHSGLLLLNTTDCKTQTDRKWTQMSRHNAGKSIQMTANKHDVVNFNTYYPPTCNKKCQMFSSNNIFFWYVTWLFCISKTYCNKFAGSIHNGSLLHLHLNTQLLITVHNASRILTHVWQILELQPILLLILWCTGSLIQTPNYTPNTTGASCIFRV